MRKSLLALTVVAALAIAGSAFARDGMAGKGPGMGRGMGPGMEQGMCPCCGPGSSATPEQIAKHKKFIADTLPLQEELHAKRMELEKEWIKDNPDTEKISKLKTELRGLYKKMHEAREKAGIKMGWKGGKKGGCCMDSGMMGDAMGPGCQPCAPAAPPAAPAK